MKNGLPKENEKTFQQDILKLIETHTDKNYWILIPTPLIHFTGDLKIAAFLSHLLYWTGKGGARDGFIFKSARECKQETGLTKYAIGKASRKLENLGVLETKKKKANGSPTIHYRLKKAELKSQLSKFLADNSLAAEKQRPVKKTQPVEPPSKTHESAYVLLPGIDPKKMPEPISLSDFLYICSVRPKYTAQAEYFVDQLLALCQKTQPPYQMKQWMSIFDTFSLVSKDSEGTTIQVTPEQMRAMIDKYFETNFPKDCDRSLMHFNNGEVKMKLFNDIQTQSNVKGEQQ